MRYLENTPFQVGGATKQYSENWDRIFGKKEIPDAETVPREHVPAAKSCTCEPCMMTSRLCPADMGTEDTADRIELPEGWRVTGIDLSPPPAHTASDFDAPHPSDPDYTDAPDPEEDTEPGIKTETVETPADERFIKRETFVPADWEPCALPGVEK